MEHDHSGPHAHVHSPSCGHTAVIHDGHVDYLHDGHLHHVESGKVVEHAISVTAKNPDVCTEGASAQGHELGHVHGPNCGHAIVPHGDHMDYLVDGILHHAHGAHCDNHGAVALA